LIPQESLIQTKAQTHLIESGNMPKRHWFARLRRNTRVVSRSLLMIGLTAVLYAVTYVNKSISMII
jgi:IS1 family transposase